MKLISISHFATTLFLTLGLFSWPTQAQVMGFYHTQKTIQSDETLPATTSTITADDPGIDFKEWDKDLDKSIKKIERKCKGKNCNFKTRQAFESSFDM
jgi:hypothetical protein